MLTGLYPHEHGVTENDGRFGGRAGLTPDDWTFNRAFERAGYSCAWFGKWHVNNQLTARDFGFAGFAPAGYGYPYGTPEYRDYLARYGLEAPMAKVTIPGESHLKIGTRVSLLESGDWFDDVSGALTLEGSVLAHESHFVVDEARRWFAATSDPKLVRVDPWGPHPPYLLGGAYTELDALSSVRLPGELSQRPEPQTSAPSTLQGRMARCARHGAGHVASYAARGVSPSVVDRSSGGPVGRTA